MIQLFLLAAFLVGSLPFAFLIGKWRGVDIRKIGSGNVGATNLARALGPRWGVLAFLIDAAKGAASVWFARLWFPDIPWLPVVAGGSAVTGHCFSPFLGLKGGKGVATSLGVLSCLIPYLTLLLLGCWVVAIAITRSVGIASSIAATVALAAGVYGALSPAPPDWTGMRSTQFVPALLIAVGVLVIVRHRRNIANYCRRTPTGGHA